MLLRLPCGGDFAFGSDDVLMGPALLCQLAYVELRAETLVHWYTCSVDVAWCFFVYRVVEMLLSVLMVVCWGRRCYVN